MERAVGMDRLREQAVSEMRQNVELKQRITALQRNRFVVYEKREKKNPGYRRVHVVVGADGFESPKDRREILTLAMRELMQQLGWE